MNSDVLSLSAVNLTVTKEAAVIFAAVIAAVATLTAALTAGVIAMRNEKGRQQSALDILALQLDRARVAERQKLLRETAAEFSLQTIQFAEVAAAVERGRLALSARRKINPELEQKLRDANGDIRMQFQVLLLVTESLAVQEAARMVLQGAWNEREQALGRPRKHGRITSEHEAIVKEMRARLRPFMEAVRSELGISGQLADEPT